MPKFIYVVRHHVYEDVAPGNGPKFTMCVAAFMKEKDAVDCVLDHMDRYSGELVPEKSIFFTDSEGFTHVVNYTQVELYEEGEKAEVGP